MFRKNVFRFMAFTLEGVGQPKGDDPTLYGINKRWHPKEYGEMLDATESYNPVIIQKAIEDIYSKLYQNSIAQYFKDYYPLNFNIFDMTFNKGPDDATVCWQQTYNEFRDKKDKKLFVDGKFGHNTLNSLKLIDYGNVKSLNEYYSYMRIQNYRYNTKKKEWVDGLVNRVINLSSFFIKGGL